jgi:DNA-binding MarR family transcriptional regulator
VQELDLELVEREVESHRPDRTSRSGGHSKEKPDFGAALRQLFGSAGSLIRMTTSKQTVALALTGAVALASGAYALGSQAGDGDASAAKTSSGTYGGPPPGPGRPGFGRGPEGPRHDLSGLATRLGVSEAALRKALEDLRPAQRPDPRDDMAQELADALGIDVAKVQATFDKLRPQRERHEHGDLAAALAKKLGVSTAKVQSALDAQRDHRGDPDALAKALGVTPAKLRQAFAGLWRDHRPGRDHARGPATAALAKELGVTQAQLKAAFDKLKAAKEKEFADRRSELAKQLAAKLGLDASKVEKALETPKMFRGRPGP